MNIYRLLKIVIIQSFITIQLLFPNYVDLLIDPGHGGSDTGQCGWGNVDAGYCNQFCVCPGYYGDLPLPSEEEINLDIAEEVDWELDFNNLPNLSKKFTRYTDTYYSQLERIAIANGELGNELNDDSPCGFAITIHQNGNVNNVISGTKSFYSDDWSPNPSESSYSHPAKYAFGQELTESVHSNLIQMINSYPNYLNYSFHFNDGIMDFIDGTHCQSSLLEVVFLSNQIQYEQISNDWFFQLDVAEGIANGIAEHYYSITDEDGDFLNGDVNLDLDLNVLDIVQIVSHILQNQFLLNLPAYLGDYNNDNSIDILDIVSIIEDIFNLAPPVSGGNYLLSFNVEEIEYPNYKLITYLINEGPIRGLSIEIELPDGFEGTEIIKGEHAYNMTLESKLKFNNNERKVKKVFYNADGDVISSGFGEISIINIKQNLNMGRLQIGEIIDKINNSETILSIGKTVLSYNEIDFTIYLQLTNSNQFTIPFHYNLKQAYPNPFNPITNITYEIPEDSFITIAVYNLAGRKVDELVSGLAQSGRYNITWNADQFSSGVYLVNMSTPSYTALKKSSFTKVVIYEKDK